MTVATAPVLEPLLKSPKLVIYTSQLQQYLDLPDVVFFAQGKAAQFSPQQVKYPPPDFVVEVLSPSTAALDRGIKFEEYATSGVAEYWIIDAEQQTVEQYILHNESYELLLKLKGGEISSEVIKGFTIPVPAIFDRKLKNQTLTQLLNSE